MSVFVKVCGLTRDADVAAAVAAGADALGFVFAASTRRVAPDRAAALSAQIPSGVLKVAVMQHPSQEEWETVARVFAADVLQTDAADFAVLDVPHAVSSWPVVREGSDNMHRLNEVFVYEGKQSGRGKTVDWARAAQLARDGRMILAGGLGPHNVAAAIAAVQPFGVDASSGLEVAPGEKSAEKVAEFVRAAKRAGNDL